MKKKFLNFLTRDIEQNPQNMQVINADLVEQVQDLAADVELDFDALLADEEE
ncbi:MAG: type II toxin-antitoxin system PrlF family antitoxin [Cyanobacteria bacterium P01_G01_bin.54]